VLGVSDAQVTLFVKSCVLPLLNVPVAANCRFVPSEIDGVAGATAIDTSVAGVTVKVVDPLTDPDVAIMLVVPVPTLVATTCVPPTLLTVATDSLSTLHCAVCVMSWVVPSVNVPVAVNCRFVPSGVEASAGVTATETGIAGLTVSVFEPIIDPEVAVTLVFPTATLVAKPWLFTVATPLLPEVHATESLKSSVLPSV